MLPGARRPAFYAQQTAIGLGVGIALVAWGLMQHHAVQGRVGGGSHKEHSVNRREKAVHTSYRLLTEGPTRMAASSGVTVFGGVRRG